MKTATRLAAALVMAGATLAAGAASAKIVSLGSLSLNDALTIPTTTLYSSKHYYFTFDLLPTQGNVLSQLAATFGVPASSEPIQFSLFSGTPKGAHSFVAQSGDVVGATLLVNNLTSGNYYIRVDRIAVNGEQAGGAVSASTAVPEPASWALLIAGFGMAGYALRRRRTALSLA